MAQELISEPCSWFHRQDNSYKVLLLQKLSGIGLNRMGLIQQCQKQPNVTYFLMIYTLNYSSSTFYTGLCYSTNCTAADIISISRSVNQYIPLPFADLTILQMYAKEDFFNVWTITGLSILGMLSLISLVATLLSFLLKNKTFLGQYFSLNSCYKLLISKTGNYERIKIMAGLRALSFLAMILSNLISCLLQSPTLPQPPLISKYALFFHQFFDLWLLISGFYYAFELSKEWNKNQSPKIILYTLLKHLIKPAIMSSINVILVLSLSHTKIIGSYWQIYNIKSNSCGFFSIFGSCDYYLLIWVIQAEMCTLMTVMFMLYQSNIRYQKIVYGVVSCLLIGVGIALPVVGDGSFMMQCGLVNGMGYLMGFNLGLGYFWFRGNRAKPKILILRLAKFKLWRISWSILMLVILTTDYFYLTTINQPTKPQLVFLQFLRIVAPLSWFGLVGSELLGYQNIFGTLLKDRFMNIISKLSFSSYTINCLACLIVVNSLHEDIYVSCSKLLVLWMASLGLSLILGFFLAILIQMPMYKILRATLGRNDTKSYIQFY